MFKHLLIALVFILIYVVFYLLTVDHLKMYEETLRMNYRGFCEEGFFYHYKRPLTIKQVRKSEKVCPQL